MNIKEWHKACEEGWAPRRYDNASREIQRSFKYNPDPNATVRHHLRDTEEQRKYNDEHYELWGFEIDENGNEHFEYGKYIVFVTEEEHISKYHNQSGENNYFYGKHHTEETKRKISERFTGEKHPFYGKHHTEETLQKISDGRKNKLLGPDNPMYGKRGELHPFYGHHLTNSHKQAISKAQKGKERTDEEKEHNRQMHIGKHHTDITRRKISNTICVKRDAYRQYKSNGGTMTWNEFQKIQISDYIDYGITLEDDSMYIIIS